ncbi:carboxypeptidase-like regulatory domain-containing protein [Christiangramia sp. LLG6405-1]|uniref:carboxypeptidase-like regulatory domain-containing protein n=1 Tax=Christiangramia sp. LLG6405-1 TaxID=3160832 RepID=UPI00386E9C4E
MKYLLLFLLLAVHGVNYAQEVAIRGKIFDNQLQPLEMVLVQTRTEENQVLDYTYSDQNGNYQLQFITSSDSINVEVSSLGFSTVRRALIIADRRLFDSLDFEMEEKAESLKEVVVEGHQKIRISSDTTFIRVSQYATDTEQTVEDLLKRLPGIEVLPDGSIKAHGKPIETLLVEGENILDKNYKILSKNLDAKTLEEVQILENYEENPIFKQLSSSEKVALNLKLKDEFKYVLFGNISGGYGLENRYESALTLGLLRKEIKVLEFSNLNNTGYKAADLLQNENIIIDLSQMFQKIEKQPFTIFSIDEQEENIFNTRSIFNTSMLHSIGLSTRINDEFSLRGDVSVISDVTRQFYEAQTEYLTGTNSTIFSETSNYKNSNLIGDTELEFKFVPNSSNYFTNTIRYNLNPHDAMNNIILGDQGIMQENDIASETFYNHLEHTLLLNNKNALNNYLYFGYGDSEENAQIIHPGLSNLLDSNIDEPFYQNVRNKFKYYGLQSSLLSKSSEWENQLQLHIHHEGEIAKSQLFTAIEMDYDEYTNAVNIDNFSVALSNSLKFKFNQDNYFRAGISMKRSWFNHDGYLLKNANVTFRQKLRNKGVVRLGYSYKEDLPRLKFLLSNYALNSYQDFFSGSDDVIKLGNSVFSLNYSLYNDIKGFYVNASAIHTETHSGYAPEAYLTENFIFNSFVPTSSGQSTLANLIFTNYFSKLKMASKIESNQNFIQSPFSIDQTSEFKLQNYSGDYSLSLSSYYDKWFNFSSGFTYTYASSELKGETNSFETSKAFVNFDLNILESIKVNVSNELYILNKENYNFVNANIVYEPKQSRWSGTVQLNNLLNEREYLYQNINSFKLYQKRIDLVPAYALLSIKYRF